MFYADLTANSEVRMGVLKEFDRYMSFAKFFTLKSSLLTENASFKKNKREKADFRVLTVEAASFLC
jgi:hypothetical protein